MMALPKLHSMPGAVPVDQKATLMFVDDEVRVLSSMRAIFRRQYRVLLANSAPEALELLANDHVDVIVSDQRMPEVTGVELLAEVKRRSPKTMRILLTGYADLEAIEHSINESEVFRYLMKPCPPPMLREAVSLAVDAARSSVTESGAAEVIEFPRQDDLQTNLKADPPRDDSPIDVRTPSESPADPQAKPRDPMPASAVAQPPQTDVDTVAVLVLTRDDQLEQVVRETAGSRDVHRASTAADAVRLLGEQEVGVLVTDTAVDEQAVDALTRTLKHEVPELVTIVVSARSDASTLIGLINHAQVYRFLVKPVAIGQCRLWLESAARKYLDLRGSPEEVARHQVPDWKPSTTAGLVNSLMSGITKLRGRFRRVRKPGDKHSR